MRTQRGGTDAVLLLARAEARLGRNPVARELYKQLDPNGLRAEDYYLVGRGLINEGPSRAAAFGLERALELEPGHAETLVELIRFDRRSDRLSEADNQAARLSNDAWMGSPRPRLAGPAFGRP